MKLINKNKKNKGFTLIEIIVVLVIMVIMAAIAIPAVTGYIRDARNSQYVQEAHTIYTAVQAEEAKGMVRNNVKTVSDLATKESTFYTNLPTTINTKLDGKISVTSIKYNNGKYTFKFKSNNNKAVTVEFEPNTDTMNVSEDTTTN